jgi:hypothetical protein
MQPAARGGPRRRRTAPRPDRPPLAQLHRHPRTGSDEARPVHPPACTSGTLHRSLNHQLASPLGDICAPDTVPGPSEGDPMPLPRCGRTRASASVAGRSSRTKPGRRRLERHAVPVAALSGRSCRRRRAPIAHARASAADSYADGIRSDQGLFLELPGVWLSFAHQLWAAIPHRGHRCVLRRWNTSGRRRSGALSLSPALSVLSSR